MKLDLSKREFLALGRQDPDDKKEPFTMTVQIIFEGKAHPQDSHGKQIIQRIFEITKVPRFAGRIVFIENYDISVCRRLVQGVDLWINTPRRPLEACGTSGMKVAMNGGLNLSTLDG